MKRKIFQRHLLTGIKILLDGFIVYFAYHLSYLLRHNEILNSSELNFMEYFELFFIVLFIKLFSFLITGVYRHRRAFFSLDELKYVFNGIGVAFLITIFFIFFSKGFLFSRTVLLLWFTFTFISIFFFHFFFSRFEIFLYSKGFGVRNIAIIGFTETGKDIESKLRDYPSHGMHFIGYISLDGKKRKRTLGGLKDLSRLIKQYGISELMIADDHINDVDKIDIIHTAMKHGTHVIIASSLFELLASKISVTEIYGVPTLTISPSPIQGLNLALKRVMDITFSSLFLLIGSPFFLLLAIAIKINSKGPVLFSQLRVTKNGRIFKCWKFRSMVADAERIKEDLKHLNEQTDGPTFKIKNDPRITIVGKFIRKFSIDEIPQFLNVFKGEMSIVGPRPPVPSEVEEYLPWHNERLSVKQGISGLWQVSGRSELSFDDMVKLDIFYVEHWSMWLDIKIILKTIPAILSSKGAY